MLAHPRNFAGMGVLVWKNFPGHANECCLDLGCNLSEYEFLRSSLPVSLWSDENRAVRSPVAGRRRVERIRVEPRTIKHSGDAGCRLSEGQLVHGRVGIAANTVPRFLAAPHLTHAVAASSARGNRVFIRGAHVRT